MRLSRLPCAVGTRFWLLKPVWLKHSVAIWSRATISRLMLWKSACLAPEKATTEFPISLVFFPGFHHFRGSNRSLSWDMPTWSSTDSKSAVFSITSRAFCRFAQQLRQMSTKIECMTSGVLQRWHIHYRDTTLFVRLLYADYMFRCMSKTTK